MNQSVSDLIDLSTISTTLPTKEVFEVSRESNLASLISQIDAGNKKILLSGPSMSGKTVFLRQFVERYAANAVNVFLDPDHNQSSAYNLTLQELYYQLYFYENGSLPKNLDSGLEVEVASLFQRAARKSRLRKSRIIVVLDGLFDMGDAHSRVIDAVLSLLPLNMSAISYVFSVAVDKLRFAQAKISGATHQSIIPPLKEEIRAVFDGCGYQYASELEDLIELVSSDLSFAASLRRLIDGGCEPREILKGSPVGVQEVFELELERISASNPLIDQILPFLVHTPRIVSAKDLAELCGVDSESLAELANACPQISFKETESESIIKLNSDAFRGFVERRLRSSRQATISRVVDHLKKKDRFSRELPDLFEQGGDYESLKDFINHDYLAAQLSKRKSIFDLQQTVQRALFAANKSGDRIKAFQFALCSSVTLQALHQNNRSGFVHFLLAAGDTSAAMKFARSITSIEERLKMLCQVVNHSLSRNREIGEDIMQEVRSYYDQLPEELPEKEAMSLASELVKVSRELGVKLITRVAKRSEHDNAFDWLMARMMVSDLGSLQTDDLSQIYDAFEKDVRPEQKNAVEVIKAILAVNEDPSQLARHVAHAKSIDERVFLARSFARSSASPEEKVLCLTCVVDEIISNTACQPPQLRSRHN